MKHLDARKKGEIDYDYQNDILLFKTKSLVHQIGRQTLKREGG